LFSGIGGFRAGLDRVGGFKCVGHCEIDKYAEASYRAIHDVRKEEVFYTDAREIRPEELPEFELICAGFPCQSFSVAGRRAGFGDVRGTLFFEIARLAEAKRPKYLLLENVPGLISHDGGRTFAKILGTLSDLGYGIEWSVLNSKHFGVPQSRKRLFIICYLDPRCAGEILPVFGTGAKALIPVIRGRQGYNVYSAEGVAQTQTASTGGFGGKTGLYLLIKEATKSGYKEATPEDSVDLSFGGSNTRRGRVGRDIAHTLDCGSTQGIVERGGRIRRLMPRECLRLQGFAEDQIDRLLAITSDAQAYKQAGNCVTVNVIEAIGRKLLAADNKLKEGEDVKQ
jgi:DNA (cytosine-5)-methyltransferase 1